MKEFINMIKYSSLKMRQKCDRVHFTSWINILHEKNDKDHRTLICFTNEVLHTVIRYYRNHKNDLQKQLDYVNITGYRLYLKIHFYLILSKKCCVYRNISVDENRPQTADVDTPAHQKKCVRSTREVPQQVLTTAKYFLSG